MHYTYLNILPDDLRAGDVASVIEYVMEWNTTQTSMQLARMRLIARVECLEGWVWLAENVATCEQRVIEFKHSKSYVAVVDGLALEQARRGSGQLVNRGHFYQFIREGV